jgi:hypothetical protein
MMTILAAAAQWEREIMLERQRWGIVAHTGEDVAKQHMALHRVVFGEHPILAAVVTGDPQKVSLMNGSSRCYRSDHKESSTLKARPMSDDTGSHGDDPGLVCRRHDRLDDRRRGGRGCLDPGSGLAGEHMEAAPQLLRLASVRVFGETAIAGRLAGNAA